jgi:hypothetical protein
MLAAAAAGNVTAEDLIEESRALRPTDSSPVPSPPSPPPHPEVSVETIRSILHGYDFVGVSERMDERLVALQLLLGLETSDILHMRYAQERAFESRRQVQEARVVFDLRKHCPIEFISFASPNAISIEMPIAPRYRVGTTTESRRAGA